jgi:hypothetical protein
MNRLTLASCVILLVTLAMSSFAPAQDTRRDQVAAANSRALDALRAQVTAEPIAQGITVQNLLDRTGSAKTFMKTLARAQQLGGPRWVDQTCQVRLEIAGPRVARALVEIATLARLESPVAPEVLAARLRDWDGRTFSATGTSAGAGVVEHVSDDKTVRQACAAARKDAVARVIQSTSPIPLAGGKTVGDAMANPQVRGEVEQWLAARPITQVDFPTDQARVTLAAPGDELFDTFRAAATKQKDVPLPADEKEWSRVRDEFIARAGSANRGTAKLGDGVAAKPAFAAAAAAPEWVDRQIDAQGSGTATGSRLKAARAAEADAAAKLRAKLDPLPLAKGMTIQQAVAQDKSLENAVDRALSKARTTKVDYQSDGSARVTVQLDLHDLWDELTPEP